MLNDVIQDNLQTILESIVLIENRFSEIKKTDDLVSSEYGVLILDGIAMRLQVIGELLKKISKMDETLLGNYPEIGAWSCSDPESLFQDQNKPTKKPSLRPLPLCGSSITEL